MHKRIKLYEMLIQLKIATLYILFFRILASRHLKYYLDFALRILGYFSKKNVGGGQMFH